jgi:hypothetical protein
VEGRAAAAPAANPEGPDEPVSSEPMPLLALESRWLGADEFGRMVALLGPVLESRRESAWRLLLAEEVGSNWS